MMKRVVPILIGLVCVSVALAGYDDGIISTGEYEYGVEWFTDSPPLIVEGGGADVIDALSSSYLEVRYTSIPVAGDWNTGGIRDIVLNQNSELCYLNGATDLISFYGSSTATLKGGSINSIRSFQVVDATGNITIECQPGWSWLYTSGEIKGIAGLWADGSSFEIDFIDKDHLGYDPVYENINVVEVPEPITLTLLGLGGLLIRKRKA